MPIKGMLALYIGGMGARGRNFYNDYAKRLGYEEAAVRIQDLYLDGKKAEAMAAVPDALVDDIALVGPRERVAERFEAWKASPAGSVLVGAGQPEVLRLLAELAL
jgi:alkanesulfonate monooxygenase SsuD/methylene tetrahydromethanopterin reductase-like flavin-dependent oxidoreductase (luciferase family)